MVEMNQKVEYKSLLGFPENHTNEVLYLKSTEDETGFKGVSSEDIREEFSIENPSIKHYNYIKKSPKLFDDIDEILEGDIVLTSKNDYKNPLVYIDDNGVEHMITSSLSVVLHPTVYKNILPVMTSLNEQGWTLSGDRMNGYEHAYPYFMTDESTEYGYYCNSAISTLNMSSVTFEYENEFIPCVVKVKNGIDTLSQVTDFNIYNSSNNVIYRGYDEYKSSDDWKILNMELIEPTNSITFKAWKSNDNTTSMHGFGRGLQILVEDETGDIYAETSTSYILLDTSNDQLIEQREALTFSQVSPVTPKENDLWLSILDKNRVYKFDGNDWILTSYIPLAKVIINERTSLIVEQYPLITNWYDMTYKYAGEILVFNNIETEEDEENTVIFESSEPNTYMLNINESGLYEVTMVGGGGAAAIKSVYDDKGYGWSGGSGGAMSGTFIIPKGNYEVVVGSANNNTKAQGSNIATLNPDDTTTHDTYITGVARVGGGGSGTTSGAGVAGASATYEIEPMKTTLNTIGNAGVYGSGGKGSSIPPKTCAGGDSVYEGHGKGQGCVTSEYASSRKWIDGTNGYVKIVKIN